MDRSAEQRLIRQAKAGEGDAVAALIRAHQDGLYAFMLRMSGRPEVAEDIVQESFVRVLKNLERFDDRYRFSTWLFTIARRLYVNAMQKHKPASDSEMVAQWHSAALAPPALSTASERQEIIGELVQSALGSLSNQQREIILLFHQQCWSIGEIASHLTMPEGTVKSHLHRARKRMMRSLTASQQMQVEEVWS